MKKIIVIGAGASGMMAAGTAGINGADVLLFEKNEQIGKKILITGKGRCNVTNNCDVDTFIKSIPSNGKFLYSAANNFTPHDTINFFTKYGIHLKTERGNRVFPVSDKATDIVKALSRFIDEAKVQLINERVKEIISNNNTICGIRTYNNKTYEADAVILTCGGCSYPKTGSNGDGFKIAKKTGHTITQIKPSLVPMVTKQTWCHKLQGLSLKNVAIKIVDMHKNKSVYSDFGEMLFTHFGVSGPIVLSASSHIRDSHLNKYHMFIDLKPALSIEKLDARILRDFTKNIHKDLDNSLFELLPKKIIPIIIDLAGIPHDIKCEIITKEMRNSLINKMKNLDIEINGFRPIEEAIITSGGVKVSEINPSTMESKIIKGLYFAGEVIDVDAYTGGFNLQIAFSTGHLAGISSSLSTNIITNAIL